MGICYDNSQQQVIAACGGSHLVLAPPGCGKTQILTERIRVAHEAGVDYGDMLCLTFTNRAARGMVERIATHLNVAETEAVYVGNVHRFCSKFLFSNGLVAAETAVIDEDDAMSIMAKFFEEDEYAVLQNRNRRREYSLLLHFANFMEQIRHGHARTLRMHPECVNADDVVAMRKICKVQRMEFDAKAMIDLYDHADFYISTLTSEAYDFAERTLALRILRKMLMAHRYADYKKSNRLIDFQELLMRTYDALAADTEGRFKRYRWVQVDEVQDLNALQMAIIDLLTAQDFDTVMFLGDEQQAIFSFMGAKMETLESLKRRCMGHVHHLSVNHRSPKYLLDAFNAYATQVLGIDPSLLPQTQSDVESKGRELGILKSETIHTEVDDVVQLAQRLYDSSQTETTAIIVNANDDAQMISEALSLQQLPHFKVSGTDLFSLPEVKLLTAHLGVLANETNFLAWARILKGMHVFEGSAAARKFVRSLLDRAIMPSDLILFEGHTTYVQRFRQVYEEADIVVFDTETTGLDVCHNDIVQIAAVKMRQGRVVKGSAFCVYIATEQPIPQFLGDLENPITEEMKHHEQLPHAEALLRFLSYAQGCVLLGHNADFDYNILRYNLRRYCPDVDLPKCFPEYIDTLRLVRLLEPDLKEHKLKYLLSALNLEGTNSHLADDDVNATCSVVAHCYKRSAEVVEPQRQFLEDRRVREKIKKLVQNYGPLFTQGRQRLYSLPQEWPPLSQEASVADNVCQEEPLLVRELKHFYGQLLLQTDIAEVPNLHYLFDYLSTQLIDQHRETLLAQQIGAHYMELSTLKEADLCGSNSMKERLFVTTIHKAKGLEFDNVVVFDAVDGRIPNFFCKNDARLLAEEARKLYVAITRAKRRLYIAQSMVHTDYHNQRHERQLTRFMQPIAHLFCYV